MKDPTTQTKLPIIRGLVKVRNEAEIIRLGRVSKLVLKKDGSKPKNAATDVVSGTEIFIPLEGLVDADKEKERLGKEINNLEGYLKGLTAKLSNKKFVSNAPKTIVEVEKKKLEEAEGKLEKLKGQLDV